MDCLVVFPGLEAYLPCPGGISEPAGAETPGTEAEPWNPNYLIFTLLYIYIS